MNRSKTELFVAGLSQLETNDLTALGFSLGSLPVRYLGLPLMHRKLRICDYRPLLDQLKAKFTSWTARALSFAGRRELLSSVIHGTINFWFSTFLLPKGCIKSIESLCCRFLWNGNISERASAKVSWTTVCHPKEEGGLGLRDLPLWNKTLCLKLVWLLFSENESLWAHWTKVHRLKGESIWSIDVEKQASWIWKSILKLRPLAEDFVKCIIGNGLMANFWYDDWSPLGPLIKLIGLSGPRQLGVRLTASVGSVCTPLGWNIRPARSDIAMQIHIMLCSLPLPALSSCSDRYIWQVDGQTLETYSARHTWDSLRHHQPPQGWEKKVWYRGHIPSHAFLMWVAQLDRLPTRTRIASWGQHLDTYCCFCDNFPETRDHIFLRCEYSEQLWTLILRRLGYQAVMFHTWTALLEWSDIKDTTCPTTLRLLVIQATIYKIWFERNARLHSSPTSTPQGCFKIIDRLVRQAIIARKNRKSFRTLLRHWLKHSI
ncbi:hypothetical protein Bca52824_069657 [Brassica carinata]|uniref:Reverse transcriptase zinc-binding domain-containing protein n=1 Tax=Brassica carinata TaxID=52824 RepID=A0A8X7Q6D3_BRACI|nr:hypothetical protein Bca52824_069657 [Brassica carinata]